MVRFIAGTGELVVLPNEGHLLSGAGDILHERVTEFVEACPPDPTMRKSWVHRPSSCCRVGSIPPPLPPSRRATGSTSMR